MLRLIGAAPLLAARVLASTTPARRFSAAERRLAALGGRITDADPMAAQALLRFAMQQAACGGRDAVGRRDAHRVCAALLDGPRIAREFRDGLVHSVDGWLLSRSEASTCVYLHRLALRPG